MSAFCVFGMTEPLAKALAAKKSPPPRTKVAVVLRLRKSRLGDLKRPSGFSRRDGPAKCQPCLTRLSSAKTGWPWPWPGAPRTQPA